LQGEGDDPEAAAEAQHQAMLEKHVDRIRDLETAEASNAVTRKLTLILILTLMGGLQGICEEARVGRAKRNGGG